MPLEDVKERNRAIENAVGQIEKQFGKGSIMRLGQRGAIQPIDAIPTGAISIDYALGVGGIPRGRVVEIFGPESSGKTTVALHAIANGHLFIDPRNGGPLDEVGRCRVAGDALEVQELRRRR